jgi:bacillithiol system protein YtxJ
MNWIPLTSESQLETIREQSKIKPVMVFKHSTRCSVSAAVLDRLNRTKNDGSAESLNYFLDLIAHRDISNAIAAQFNVEHESPQMIIIRNGIPSYVASHFEISFTDYRQAMDGINN